ncbi:MAG: T9SS type A sorting domain-containing protein [Bacteroidetes bacterium]|nr:T9SS type A sorting domain-containing protein [Bacteroidota bacterium]
MLKTRLVILFFFSASYCFSQLEIVPIYRHSETTTTKATARTAELTAMSLPFWDDFSFNIKDEKPNDTLWQVDSKSVWVNNGSGINPPSIYVATFDGYDATGKPYSANDILAKGFADAMTSRSLKLGDVAPANRNAVFMTFFYQYSGNGDNPEPGDILSLLFKNAAGQWIEVWSKTNDGTLALDKFTEVTINLRSKESTPEDFFHNDFQFQFRSFGRLSGPYDVWNVDYVYVSNGKPKEIFPPGNDAPYLDFPDRSVISTMTTMLSDYWSMPAKHFFSNLTNNIKAPKVTIASNRKDQIAPFGETVNYSSEIRIGIKSSVTTQLLETATNPGNLSYQEPKNVSINIGAIPDLSAWDSNDSINLKVLFLLNSKDNIKKISDDVGDWDEGVYKSINFKSNDTISATHILSNYYAYDDGKAEFGIKLNGKGTQLAYEFNMKTTTSDSIVAIDIYFPKYGDDTNQYIQLFIASSLPANENEYNFKQTYAVQRTTRNQFVRFKIPGAVAVKDKFYIGWQLNSEVVIPVGLDRNSDSGSKIYSKVLGAANWEQNTTVYGSIMMRPVFGKPATVISGVEPSAASKPYPNPNSGTFYLPAEAELIQLFDLSGKSIEFTDTQLADKKQITILTPTTGLFFVRYFNQQWVTEKIVVRP